jgi:hypothetical protein
MEYPVYGSESAAAERQQLAIVSNPLLGCIDCVVSIGDIAVEHIRLTSRIGRSGFEICEVWRGECRPVQGRTVSFTYRALAEGLLEHRYAGTDDTLQQQLLAILEHQYCRELCNRGYGLHDLLMLGRYATTEYPLVYWLVLLNGPDWQLPENHNAITREMLARAMGVNRLSNGQMKALRKLDVGAQFSEATLQASMHFIARQWNSCWRLVAHQDRICPMILQAASLLHAMHPELVNARWFTLEQLSLWVDRYTLQCRPRNEFNAIDIDNEIDIQQSVCALFLLGKVLVHVTGMVNQWQDDASVLQNMHLLMQLQDVACLDRNAMQLLLATLREYQLMDDDPAHYFGLFAIFFDEWITTLSEDFPPSLRSSVMDAWHTVLERVRGQINDDLYNHDQPSLQYTDDVPLLKLSNMLGDSRFSLITTAGHLREMASLLRNCAASRVHDAVLGNAEFWLYRNELTRETALLQIDKKANAEQFVVVEFNGFSNRGVSQAAQSHLADWLLRQSQSCYNPYAVRSHE